MPIWRTQKIRCIFEESHPLVAPRVMPGGGDHCVTMKVIKCVTFLSKKNLREIMNRGNTMTRPASKMVHASCSFPLWHRSAARVFRVGVPMCCRSSDCSVCIARTSRRRLVWSKTDHLKSGSSTSLMWATFHQCRDQLLLIFVCSGSSGSISMVTCITVQTHERPRARVRAL